MARVKPANAAEASAVLTPGGAVAAPCEAKMVADNFVGCAA